MSNPTHLGGIEFYKYSRIHILLARKYGKANKCENPMCKVLNPSRYEWALIKGMEYSLNRENYMQLCINCHRKYDDSPERRQKLSKANKGKVCHNRSRIIGQFDSEFNLLNIYESSLDAERKTGISHSNIYNGMKKQCRSGGFYWMHLDGK